METGPTYHVGEVFELIRMIEDTDTLEVLASVIQEERYQYTLMDLYNIKDLLDRKRYFLRTGRLK